MLQEPTKPSRTTLNNRQMDKVPLLVSPPQIEGVTLLRTLKPRSGIIESLVLSSDGWTLVSGGGNGTIKVLAFDRGELERTLTGQISSVKSLALSSDEQTLVSGSRDKKIRVFRA